MGDFRRNHSVTFPITTEVATWQYKSSDGTLGVIIMMNPLIIVAAVRLSNAATVEMKYLSVKN